MLKGMLNKIAAAALMLGLFSACGRGGAEVAVYTNSPIYPDYMGVTIPSNIAPLNFHYTSEDIRNALTTVRYKETVHTFKGREVVWKMDQWKSLLASAESDTLRFSAEIRMKGGRSENLEWDVYVSPDRIDPYLSYRLIEPGYEVLLVVEIRERCV